MAKLTKIQGVIEVRRWLEEKTKKKNKEMVDRSY